MKNSIKFLCFFVLLAYSQLVFSQTDKRLQNELVILAGLIQPALLQGGNFEVDYYTPKMVFNYSHGFSLDLDSKMGTTVGDIKAQHLAIHIPFSTGLGVGYRLNKYFDVRFEPKLHKFEVYYDGTERGQEINQITDYTTFTFGLGGYFRWKPFEKQATIFNGIFISTSIRYLQKIHSSLDNGEVQYFNHVTDQEEVHKAANIGIANTPFIFNLAIGYCITF